MLLLHEPAFANIFCCETLGCGFGGRRLAKVSQNSQQVKGHYKKKPSETLYYR